MKPKTILKPIIALMAAFALLFSPVMTTAESEYSLTVTCESDGGTFNIYRVGEFTEDNAFCLSGDFSKYSGTVNLSGLSARGWRETAATLYNYAVTDNSSPAYSGTVTGGGLKFEGLSRGLYLVSSAEWTAGGYDYTTEAFLICLPNLDESLNWTDDVTVSPKTSKNPSVIDEDDEVNIVVIWVNDNETVRPSEVEYTLYRDGEEYDTFTIGSKDNWQSVFESLEPGHVWTITESDLPDGYTITIEKDDETNTIVVTNTYSSKGGDEPENTTEGTTSEETTAQITTEAATEATTKDETPEITTKKTSSGGRGGKSYVIGGETEEPAEKTSQSRDDKPEYTPPTPSESYTPGVDTLPGAPEAPAENAPVDETASGSGAAPSAPIETLPQTGQLWLPVPILAFVGIILFMIGYIRQKRSEK